MKTLLSEIAAIETHLLGTGVPEDALLFEAKSIIDPELRIKTTAQQKTYRLIKLYGRKQLKTELDIIHNKLFTEQPYHSFAQRVKQLFKRNF